MSLQTGELSVDPVDPSEFDPDVCWQVADINFHQLYLMDGVVPQFEFGAATFSTFIIAVEHLLSMGWTEAELIKEIKKTLAESPETADPL